VFSHTWVLVMLIIHLLLVRVWLGDCLNNWLIRGVHENLRFKKFKCARDGTDIHNDIIIFIKSNGIVETKTWILKLYRYSYYWWTDIK